MQVVATWPGRQPLAHAGEFARRVEELGFDVLHVPETIHDPFTVAALALDRTSTLVVRTSMVVAFPRSPMVTAYAAWDLARFSGGRFELGVASQVRGNIVDRFSTAWDDPVSRLGDYLDSLRAIFHSFQTGDRLDHHGPHYRFTRLQPYFNPGPLDVSAPSLWTGAVNHRMCVLAGERSDGFVCHPTSSHPEVLRSAILPALDEGRAVRILAGPGPKVVASPQPVTGPDRAAVAEGCAARRQELAFLYSTPAYRLQLATFGLGEVGRELSRMAADDDWSGLERQLPDDVVRRLVPAAPYEELPDVLDEWYGGLCDGLVLTVPDDTTHDDRYAAMVARCARIPTVAGQPDPPVPPAGTNGP